jgi:hypothetical protein
MIRQSSWNRDVPKLLSVRKVLRSLGTIWATPFAKQKALAVSILTPSMWLHRLPLNMRWFSLLLGTNRRPVTLKMIRAALRAQDGSQIQGWLQRQKADAKCDARLTSYSSAGGDAPSTAGGSPAAASSAGLAEAAPDCNAGLSSTDACATTS